MENIIEILPVEKSRKYVCEICDTKSFECDFRVLKDIEEVRVVCGERIAGIIEKKWYIIDFCDNKIC